ncbi:hypothetical protein ACFQY5_28875 [Paeniroseomonas aquatica]|uniref:Tryptophan-rich sensory protein n=1 Tax=Paeniroseomonas aquatica TaxID=373043 RepID=A0ABT8AER1_9PROT|nr:hypothetical protein [Paeniroseomonas aquatica]MDN3568254.1 hypothetical protein [Paeniroseomonas aquatica]
MRLLNLLLAALLPVAGVLSSLLGIGHPLWAMPGVRTLVVPAPYAFSIWGPIFALALAWGFWQARPAQQRAEPRVARLRGPAAAAFALMLAWMVAAQLTPNGWHLLAIMLALLAAALLACTRAVALPAATAGWRWIVRPLFGLLAGWISAAAVVNLSGAAAAEGFAWFGIAPGFVAMGLVLVAAWIATAVLRRTRGDRWYAGAVLWALAAIVVAQAAARAPDPAVALVAGLGMVMVAVASFLAGRQPPEGYPG